MFTTHGESLETLTNKVSADGEANWLYMLRRQHTPWFHLGAYDQTTGNGEEYVVLMLDSIRALEAVLTRDDYWVLSVQVVMPSYMNGKDGWSMEPLSELTYTLDNDGMQVAIYRTKSGATYQHSAHGSFDSPHSGPGSRAAMDENCVFRWFPT